MKYRKLFHFILLTIIFAGIIIIVFVNANGITRSGLQFKGSLANNHFVLGNEDYINNIRDLANTSGSQAALNRVMSDVDKYGHELDNTDYQNNLRLYKQVSYLINRIGYVDINTHYFRNKLNRTPKTLKDMLKLNSALVSSKHWRLLAVKSSVYHIQGKDGIYNLKFISPDGFCEAVYNRNGDLLTEANDPINMGTFNYSAGIPGLRSHQKFDIDPYFKWGNSHNSPQKGTAQIMKGVKEAIKMYNDHSTSVMAYRAGILKLFKVTL